MTKKQKLTVKTDVGTFTRTTARTYTHVVLVAGMRHELLEARRLAEMKHALENAAKYEKAQATGVDQDPPRRDPVARAFDLKFTAERVADGSFGRWAAEARERAAKLDAQGPVTEDTHAAYGALGWAGRLDLARKLAATSQAQQFRHVRVYDVKTGQEVR